MTPWVVDLASLVVGGSVVSLGVAEVGFSVLDDPVNMLVDMLMVSAMRELLGVGTVPMVTVMSVSAVLLTLLFLLVVGTVCKVVVMLLLMSVAAVPLR